MVRYPEVLGGAEPFVLVELQQAEELLVLLSRHQVPVLNCEGPGTLRRLRFPTLTSHEAKNLLVFLAVTDYRSVSAAGAS